MTHDGQEYSLIRYDPVWKDQIFELQTHLWDPDPAVNASYFEWKYERNPLVDGPLIYLATFEGQLVAMRGFWSTSWEGGSPRATAELLGSGDLVVEPSHRIRGLFAHITAFAEEDLAKRGQCTLINMSAGPSTYLASLAMGWKPVGFFGIMRRDPPRGGQKKVHLAGEVKRKVRRGINRIPFVSRVAKRALGGRFRTDVVLGEFDRCVRGGGRTEAGVRASQEPRPDAMAALIQRLAWNGRLRQVRSPAFLAWRYQNPLSRYRFLYHGSEDLDGYMVLQARYSGYEREVNIVDWEAENDRVRADLLRAALETCRSVSLNAWTDSLPASTRELLDRSGFRPFAANSGVEGYRPSLLVKTLASPGPEIGEASVAGLPILEPTSWDLRMLYSDQG